MDVVKKEISMFEGVTKSSCGDPEGGGPGWVKFRLEKSELGWRTLEFLAWIMTDMRRAGERLNFLPTAPPPYLNEPGDCLSLVLEVYPEDGDEAERFQKVAEFIQWSRTEHWEECVQ